MDYIEGILGHAVSAIFNFIVYSFGPWIWENKVWLVVAIPFIILITVVKWIRGG